MISGSEQSFTVSGLTVDVTHYFAIKTADEASNWSDVSNSPSGTTSGSSGTETEHFEYDILDRLETVSGPYSENYAYDALGNLSSHNGVNYTYNDGAHIHAVTAFNGTNYEYDDNGNMTTRGGQTITWDDENRPITIADNNSTTTFVYDGDGKRVKKIENEQTTLFINRYYEVNLTTENVTCSYYLGDKLVAQKTGETMKYLHQDHLGGTSAVSSDNGSLVSSIAFTPFGGTRYGDAPTDKKFTGQRLDGTGPYYYGARYYDPTIGRFISADSILPDFTNPQALNRYTYVLNNPLQYVDPSGHWPNWSSVGRALSATGNFLAKHVDIIQTTLDVAGMIPVVGEAFDAVNGVIYAARGDALNAALSFSAMVPVAGTISTGAKLAVKAVDKVHDVIKAVDTAQGVAKVSEKKIIQRAMSINELENTVETGLLRGGKEGTHYVSNSISKDALRARQRLALDETPEVRVTMSAPAEWFSSPSTIKGAYKMQGGGLEMIASGKVPVEILDIWYYVGY